MVWVGELWLVDTIGVVVHSLMGILMESIKFFFGILIWEIENFLNNGDVRSVDLFDLWNPLAVNFFLEGTLGWCNCFVVVHDIVLDFLTEILVSLSGSSIVAGNFTCVLELEVSGMLVGHWGVFSLGNLIVPGSSVHVLDSLGSDFPCGLFFLECFSSTIGVLKVSFKIVCDIEFELCSLVDVIINLSSDHFTFFLLNISNQSVWFHHSSSLLWSLQSLVEFNDGGFVSSEFLWPLSFSGSFESSLIGTDGILVVNPVFLELLLRCNIISLSSSPFVKDGFLVVNSE